ncbi:MAG: hypothetical protein LBS36_12550 [Oscillospiraceae bacterium]|jgi:hypothetical protein|nr:hypothetical protein [Oscillospiraceae bacterium]
MKQKNMKHIATLLVTILLLLPFTLGATVFAADEGAIAVGETKEITVDTQDDLAILTFIPEESGYYLLSSNGIDCDPIVVMFDENDIYLKEADDSANGSNFELLYYFQEGKTYSFEISDYDLMYYWETPPAVTSATFSVSLEFLGELESVTMITPPEKTTYIYGIGAFSYEDIVQEYFNRTPEDLLNDPSVPEYIKEEVLSYQNGVLYFRSYGIEVEAVFSSGETKTYTNYGYIAAEPKEPIAIGQNTLVLTLDNCITIETEVTVIENPVESIEIIYMPDLGPIYVDWIDLGLGNEALEKYFTEIPPDGTQIQINYTDGTSKVVTADRYADLYDVDGYPIYVDLDYAQTTDDTLVFTLEYLGHTTSYSVAYSFSSSLDRVLSIFTRIAEIFNMVFSIIERLTGFSLYY